MRRYPDRIVETGLKVLDSEGKVLTPSEAAGAGRSAQGKLLAAILALFALIYFLSTFTPPLMDDADSTHAEVAREMSQTHDYVTLKVNGNRYLEKAPLMYWLVSFCYSVLGATTFATRVPTALAMLGLTLLAWHWGRRAYGERAGTYAALFTVTTAGYYLFTRILIPEALLSLFIACSFYCFLTALESRAAWRWYGGYACLALAVLTKGLLALVVVGFAMLAYLALSGDWRRWREFRLAGGILLFFLMAAPWHLLAGYRNPGFFWFYFVNEHFMRFLGKRIPHDYNKQQSSLYWGLHLIWLFPWSLYIPLALRRPLSEWLARRRQPQAQSSPAARDLRWRTNVVCGVWAAVTLVFFAFSTNQEYYTFPAYLPILLLIASQLAQEEESGARRWLSWTSGIIAVVGIGIAAVLAWGLWSSRSLPFVPDIGTVLAKPNLAANSLSMGHMLDLTGQSFAALRLPAVLAAAALCFGPLLAFWMRRLRAQQAATWLMAATMALFLNAAHIALVRFDPYLGSHNFAVQLESTLRPGDRLMIYGDQAFGSSLLFYLRRPIELVNGNTTSMWWGSTYPDAPHIFLNDGGLVRAWNSEARVFLFVPQHQNAKVVALLHPSHIFAESSGKVIYCNRL